VPGDSRRFSQRLFLQKMWRRMRGGGSAPVGGNPFELVVDKVLGNDLQSGQVGSPWATLAKAAASAPSGSRVTVIGNGNVYRETLTPGHDNVLYQSSGTPAAVIAADDRLTAGSFALATGTEEGAGGLGTSGFEDETSLFTTDFSGITGQNGGSIPTLSTANPHTGSKHLRCVFDGTNGGCHISKTFTAQTDFFVRAYVYFAPEMEQAITANNEHRVLILVDGTTEIMRLAITTDGANANLRNVYKWTCSLRQPSTTTIYAGTAGEITLGTEYAVELHWKKGVSTSDGGGELYVNGVLLGTVLNTNQSARAGVTACRLGQNVNTVAPTAASYVDYDDVKFSATGPIGSGLGLSGGTYANTYSIFLGTDPGYTVLEDGLALKRLTSPGAVEHTPGSWYWSANLLYIHSSDGSNPATSGKAYSTPSRNNAVVLGTRVDVELNGLELRGSKLKLVTSSSGAQRLTVRDCVLGNSNDGLDLTMASGTVTGNRFAAINDPAGWGLKMAGSGNTRSQNVHDAYDASSVWVLGTSHVSRSDSILVTDVNPLAMKVDATVSDTPDIQSSSYSRDGSNFGLHADLAAIAAATGAGSRDSHLTVAYNVGTSLSRDVIRATYFNPSSAGSYDFARYDAQLAEYAAKGLAVVYNYRQESPQWMNGAVANAFVPGAGSAVDTNFLAWLDKQEVAFRAWFGRYHTSVRYLELGQEMDEAAWWTTVSGTSTATANADQQRAWLVRLATAARDIDPTTRIALGGLDGFSVSNGASVYGSGRTFFETLLDSGGGIDSSLFDGLSMHFSGGTLDPSALDTAAANNFSDVQRLRNVLACRGLAGKEVWLTEWTWNSASLTETQRTNYMVTALQQLRSKYPFVSTWTYFQDVDTASLPNTGLYDTSFVEKTRAEPFRLEAQPQVNYKGTLYSLRKYQAVTGLDGGANLGNPSGGPVSITVAPTAGNQGYGLSTLIVEEGGILNVTCTPKDQNGQALSGYTVSLVSSATGRITVTSLGSNQFRLTGVAANVGGTAAQVTLTASLTKLDGSTLTSTKGAHVYAVVTPGQDWQTRSDAYTAAGTRFVVKSGAHATPKASVKPRGGTSGNPTFWLFEDGMVADGQDNENYAVDFNGGSPGPDYVTVWGSGLSGMARFHNYICGTSDATWALWPPQTLSAGNPGGKVTGVTWQPAIRPGWGNNNYTNGWTIRGIEVDHCRGSGVGVSRGTYLADVWVHHCGIKGCTNHGDADSYNNVAENCLFEFSNYEGRFPWQFASAGLKFGIANHDDVVRRCTARWNVGIGLWVDVDGYRVTFGGDTAGTIYGYVLPTAPDYRVGGGAPGQSDGNNVYENFQMGIQFEISIGGTVRNNRVANNGEPRPPNNKGFGCQIFVSTSSDVEVDHNLIIIGDLIGSGEVTWSGNAAFGPSGVSVYQVGRPDPPALHPSVWTKYNSVGTRVTRNNNVHDNVFQGGFVDARDFLVISIQSDNGDSAVYTGADKSVASNNDTGGVTAAHAKYGWGEVGGTPNPIYGSKGAWTTASGNS
jgi:hypothetical protein